MNTTGGLSLGRGRDAPAAFDTRCSTGDDRPKQFCGLGGEETLLAPDQAPRGAELCHLTGPCSS